MRILDLNWTKTIFTNWERKDCLKLKYVNILTSLSQYILKNLLFQSKLLKKVHFTLNGDLRETHIRILNEQCHQSSVLKQSSVDSFIMAVNK